MRATISEPQDNRSRPRADIAKLPDLQGKPRPPLSYLIFMASSMMDVYDQDYNNGAQNDIIQLEI